MKLKITITGPKFHEVGYRVFLGKLAISLALPGFMAFNWDEEAQQQVIALAEGDEARLVAFRKRIEERKPVLAEVSAITFNDYDGDVGRTSEYAMLLSFEQLDKAIPLLQAVKTNTDTIPQIAKNTDLIPQIAENTKPIHQILEEIPIGFAVQFRQMQADIRAPKERLGMP